MAQNRSNPIPLRPIETINKLVRTSRDMFQQTGREPVPQELAERLGIPLEKVVDMLEIARRPITLQSGKPA